MPSLALLTPEERFHFLRQIYMNAFEPVMEEVLRALMLTQDKDTQAEDIAQFVLFTLAIKGADYHGQEPILRNFLTHFRRLLRRVEKDVPPMFMAFIQALREAAAERPN